MALKAKEGGFRRKAVAAGAIRTGGTMSSEKTAEQKSTACSPNEFLRWVLLKDPPKGGFSVDDGCLVLGCWVCSRIGKVRADISRKELCTNYHARPIWEYSFSSQGCSSVPVFC